MSSVQPDPIDASLEARGRKAQVALEVLGDAFDVESAKTLNGVFALIDAGDEVSPNLALQTIMHLYAIQRTRTRLNKMSGRGIKASARNAKSR
jgi:hypothetical protein